MTRVLVVEDEESYSDALAYMLRKEGYEVAIAADGNTALTEFDRFGPDIVLLDLMLPGIPGTEVCRQIRQTSSVPVIMVSAKDDEVDKVVGLELGADDYVTKPYSARELIARIRAVLRHGGQARRVPLDRDTVAQPRDTQECHWVEVRLNDYGHRPVLNMDPLGRDRLGQGHAEVLDVEQRLDDRGHLPGARGGSDDDVGKAVAQEQDRSASGDRSFPRRDRVSAAGHGIEHHHVAVLLESQTWVHDAG